VAEVLKARRRKVFGLMVAENIRTAAAGVDEILKRAERDGVPVERVRPVTLDRLTKAGHHQGLAMEVSAYPYARLEDLLAPAAEARAAPLWLVLDHIQDPQNLGSILRSADAAGVCGVVIPQDRATAVTPAVVRASAGASEHVAVALVVNIGRALDAIREAGARLAGLELAEGAVPIHQADLTGPLALVVGSEGSGMAKGIRERCDALVAIPMRGHVGSLNAAVATAVALFEIGRQGGRR
jgi:23S rRNA (guanosine2251-2'-O)-methyltransferase